MVFGCTSIPSSAAISFAVIPCGACAIALQIVWSLCRAGRDVPLTSRRSATPVGAGWLSARVVGFFISLVGRGSAFYVRPCSHIYESYHHLYSVMSVSFRCGHQRYSCRHLVIQGLARRFIGYDRGIYTRRSDQSSSPNSHQGWSCVVAQSEFLSQRSRSRYLYISGQKWPRYNQCRFSAGRTLLFQYRVRLIQQAALRPHHGYEFCDVGLV